MEQRILIIGVEEKEFNSLKVLQEDYLVECVKTGQEGLEKAKEIHPSLVLVNSELKDWNLYEILPILKFNKFKKKIPVIVLVAKEKQYDRESGIRAGAVDCLSLPVSELELKNKVSNYISFYLCKQTIESISTLDGLTGVANKQNYKDIIKVEWKKAIQQQQTIAMSIVNLDCYKEYNETFGPLRADRTLKLVANALNDYANKIEAYLARYSGDSFVLICTNMEERCVIDVLEEMRKRIESLQIEHPNSRGDKIVTVSIGTASIVPKKPEELEEFIKLVEKRVVAAKALGRNKVVFEDEEMKEGQMEVFLFDSFKILTKENYLEINKSYNRKVWLLLVFLILYRDNDYSMDEMVEAIWFNEEVKKPEYELKRLVEELQVELEALKVPYVRNLIIKQDKIYRWNTEYMCVVDSEIFENMCKKVFKKECTEEESIKIYQKVVELYKGDFLSKIDGVDWIQSLQRKYRNWYLDAVNTLLEYYSAQSKYEEIIELCENNLDQEEFDEGIHYYYIYALINLDHKEEALEHYEYIVESYYRFLGTTPSKRIAQLYLEIVHSLQCICNEIKDIQNSMKEEVVERGAYFCEYQVFKNIYQLEARSMVRSGKVTYLGLFTLKSIPTKVNLGENGSQVIVDLIHTMKVNLRIGDLFTMYKETQFMVMLPLVSYQNAKGVMERIQRAFYQEYEKEKYKLTYDIMPVEPVIA